MDLRKRVLFLCTGNSARSQMAEAFVRKYAGDRIEAYSAGLEPRPIHPLTYRVMKESGISLEDQGSRQVIAYLTKAFLDTLVTAR